MLHGGSVSANSREPVCQSGGDLAGKCAGSGEEVVSSTGPAGGRISSGGGFAAYSPMPEYQKTVVEKYLENASAMSFAGGKGTLFNAQGRGYPDISALAHQFYIVMNGETSSVDGTSTEVTLEYWNVYFSIAVTLVTDRSTDARSVLSKVPCQH